MTTDRELLEKAAKAAGYGKVEWMVGTFGVERPHVRFDDSWSWTHWNPLTDHGAALRLAVRLRLRVEIYGYLVKVSRGSLVEADEKFDVGDPYAATSRAIVRAAAAIGEQ